MTMNYKEMAIRELGRHSALRSSLRVLPGQIARLEEKMTSLQAVELGDKTPVKNSGSRAEEWLVNNLDKKIRLENNLREARGAVETVETALDALTPVERKLLEQFYIEREPGYKDRLCQELGIEEASLYRWKNKALGKFTMAMYGIESRGTV